MPDEIGFRSVVPADGPMLARWISQPHWARWWGPADEEAAGLVAHIDAPDVGPFVFTVDGRDAGCIQWWRPDGAWEIPVEAPPATTRGIDMSISRTDDLGRGLGPSVLAAFMDRLAGEGVTRFLIDPAPENAAARRAYAKAGFSEVAQGFHSEGAYVLMVRDVAPVRR